MRIPLLALCIQGTRRADHRSSPFLNPGCSAVDHLCRRPTPFLVTYAAAHVSEHLCGGLSLVTKTYAFIWARDQGEHEANTAAPSIVVHEEFLVIAEHSCHGAGPAPSVYCIQGVLGTLCRSILPTLMPCSWPLPPLCRPCSSWRALGWRRMSWRRSYCESMVFAMCCIHQRCHSHNSLPLQEREAAGSCLLRAQWSRSPALVLPGT
jgi:hypothetical protein